MPSSRARKQKKSRSSNIDRNGPMPAAKTKATKGKEKSKASPRPSPILSIPDDVLFEILMSLGLPDSMNHKMAATLTSICKRWRVFVMGTPLFWTTICQPRKLKSYPAALNPFKRSQSALLDIYLDTKFFPTYFYHKLVDVCETFSCHLPRVKLFNVVLKDAKEAQDVFKFWKRRQLLNLQILTIRVDVVGPPIIVDMSTFYSSLIPTSVTLHALRSLTLNSAFVPHFSAQAPSVERLEINPCTGLPTLETFGVIFHQFPKLQTLILRDTTMHDNRDTTADSGRSLENTSDTELARLYPSANLRALAVYLPLLHNCRLCLTKIMKNLEYLEIVNPRDGLTPVPHVTQSRNATLYPWDGLRNLKKLRLYLGEDYVWNEATFFSSLPAGVDLEIDHPPLNSRTTLTDILNSKKFRSITIILAKESWQEEYFICKTFSNFVCSIKPTLDCPTTLVLPTNEMLDSDAINILGVYLSIRGPQDSAADGLINRPQMKNFDYDGLYDVDFEDDYDSPEENWEDQWDYQLNGSGVYEYDSDFDEYNAHHQAMHEYNGLQWRDDSPPYS